MRTIAAFIGAVTGGYFGLVTGKILDGYVALVTEARPGKTSAMILTVLMAGLWGLALRHVVGGLAKRQTVAREKVERVERTRARTGKTPPSPFPAFQA